MQGLSNGNVYLQNWFMYFMHVVSCLLPIFLTAYSKKAKEPKPEDNKLAIHMDDWNLMSADAIGKVQKMLLMLHASWCSISNTFKNDTLNEASVGSRINHTIVVGLIDGDKNYGKPDMSFCDPIGFPTFLIHVKNGNEPQRNSGALRKADFLTYINPY